MREVVRPRLLILTAGFLSAVLVCATALPSAASAGGSKSAGNGYVSWKTAADVVRGLKAHGFTCKRDGSTPDATQGFDLNGKRSLWWSAMATPLSFSTISRRRTRSRRASANF
jgi:hypothetical protein